MSLAWHCANGFLSDSGLGAAIINLGVTNYFPISYIAIYLYVVTYCQRKKAAFLGLC